MSGLNRYQEYILEATFKNAVKDKPNTSSLLAWYEENGDIKKRVDIANIWLDADKIPFDAPTLKNGEVYKYTVDKMDIEVLKYYEKIPLYKVNGTAASFSNELLINSIETSFGNGYAVALYDSHQNRVPFGLNKWVVDPCSGIVSFIENLPEGYTAPFYVSFYKYVGRTGDTGIITTDGKQTMLPGYVPTEDKSLVTKDYVDTNVTDVNSIIKKLIPNTPDTFKDKDLEFVDSHRLGYLVTSTDPEVEVVYIDNGTVKLRVPQFWDQDKKGFFAIDINGSELYRVSIEDLEDGKYEKEYLTLESVVESYPDNIVADDFYKSINLIITLDYVLHIAPYLTNPAYPIITVAAHWYSHADTRGHYSNGLTFGMDNYSEVGLIRETAINSSHLKDKYISGVPAMTAGDKIYLGSLINTLRKFRKDIHGHINVKGIGEKDVYTKPVYSSFGEAIETIHEIEVPVGVYQEQMTVNITSSNLDSITNAEVEYVWNIRTDSVSDESNRVTSPNSDGKEYGKVWSETYQMKSLKDSNELQMLNGKYQWPRGNYQVNGTELPFEDAWGAGPNYDVLPKDGIRYVTFKYHLDHANGFYFSLENAEGFTFNPTDRTFTNIASLQCIIDGKYDWLNMNIPFDGVLSPFDFENKGCLVVNRSTLDKRYCTFGTEVLTGDMYIVLGIPYNMDIKLSGISVSVEN